jgi:hypothetical protein
MVTNDGLICDISYGYLQRNCLLKSTDSVNVSKLGHFPFLWDTTLISVKIDIAMD